MGLLDDITGVINKAESDVSSVKNAVHSVAGQWVLSIPKTITNMADEIYQVATGKNPNLVVKTNDLTKHLLGYKVYANVPTTDEIYKDPRTALSMAFHNNDASTIMSTLQIASKNPVAYHTAVRHLINHFIDDFNAVNDGKGGAKTQSLLAKEYDICLLYTSPSPRD